LDELLEARATGRIVLTDWEDEFLEELFDLGPDDELTHRQHDKLLQIHRQRM
jgi:hypothetical protein